MACQSSITFILRHPVQYHIQYYYHSNHFESIIKCQWNNIDEGEQCHPSLQFDLVCDNAYKGDLSTSIYFFGMILGGPCFGYFGDRFGRRSVVAFVLFTSSIIGGVIFAFRSYIVYTVSRFVLGCLLQVCCNFINMWFTCGIGTITCDSHMIHM